MFTINFPHIMPVAFSIGGFLEVKWYSLAYIVGILIGYYLFIFIAKKEKYTLSKEVAENMATYFIIGIIIGGRLGFVLFYDRDCFIYHPMDIIKIWQGGMSFHGGLIGFIVSLYWLCRKYRLEILPLADLLCCVVSPGIMLGRIANFINAELYGRVTTMPWGVIFPNTDLLPRHPSQLYEALGEGILLFIIMLILFYFTQLKTRSGALTGVFLIGYALIRITVENFREPDIQVGFLLDKYTLGQLLSLPMLGLGVFLLLRAKDKFKTPSNTHL